MNQLQVGIPNGHLIAWTIARRVTDPSMGILQNMTNPSLDSTRPERSELPTFSYVFEVIPRVL